MDLNDVIASVQVMIHDDEADGLAVTRLEEVAKLLEEVAAGEDNVKAGPETPVVEEKAEVAEAELVG